VLKKPQSGSLLMVPCHCTGDKARNLFEKHFGEKYIKIGAGKVITLAELK